MKNFTKTIALCCVLLLGVLLIFVFTGCSSDFKEKTYEAKSAITSVTLDVDCANVTVKSTASQTKIEYQENEDFIFFIWEDNGSILLESDKPFDFILDIQIPTITVYLQKDCAFFLEMDHGSVKMENDLQVSLVDVSVENGNIFVTSLTVSGDDARFEVDNGEVQINGITATVGNLDVEVDNGNIQLTDATIALDCDFSIDNGNILADNLTAQMIFAQVENGEISIKNVECQQVDATTTLGDIYAEKLYASRSINFSVEMGEVTAQLKGEKSNFKTTVECEFGSCNISNSTSGSITLKISVEMGTVNVTFYQ